MRQMDQGEGGGARMGRVEGARCARAGLGRTGPGWAGLGWVTPWVETHDTHNHQSESDREPKSETGRDEYATSDKEMCFDMMQHP
jgi:hypothetical protein